MPDHHHQGQCLCGAVRIVVNGPLRDVTACHCSQCRRQTGLYYAATNAAQADLVIDGDAAIRWYRSSPTARRAFCQTCGSALFWQADGRSDISIMAGLFDTPSGLTIAKHIFCADKGDFYLIPPDAPQFPADG